MSKSNRVNTRDISYTSAASTWGGKVLIRAVENATGRLGLIRRATDHGTNDPKINDFWKVLPNRFGLSLNIIGGALENIPSDGPVIIVANHPFGILDGLMLGNILARRRSEFRILAHRVFRGAEDLDRAVLPISFDETKQAVQTNLATRKRALDFLAGGGAIGIFPGGTVSTARSSQTRPLDPIWRTFTAKMILKSDAVVVPIYFKGSNSNLFQWASRTHYTLRMSLLIREFRKRVDRPVEVIIGDPIPRSVIEHHQSTGRDLMDFLRTRTYSLAQDIADPSEIGFEYEEKYRGQ